MAEEVNEGTAYLRALKQATAAAAAPAHEWTAAHGEVESPSGPTPGPTPSDQFQGAEKRRVPRYKCEGSAEIREEGCDVRTWSTFTDVGLHGCYLEAQATYPAGTLLHMKLEANGVRVETKGRVRVSYPYLGMGVAFEELSEENSARLKQLLTTLSRPGVIMGPGVQAAHPSAGPMASLPEITKPDAAVRVLVEFFESRQVLMRDDFVKLVKNSQK